MTDQERAEATADSLAYYIGNLRFNMQDETMNNDFNRGRLEAYEDALQMLTGLRLVPEVTP